MPKGTRKCKVCGCEYPYCKTNRTPGIFRYQDVACSPEHGQIYLAQVLKSRNQNEITNSDLKSSPVSVLDSKKNEDTTKYNPSDDINEDIDVDTDEIDYFNGDSDDEDFDDSEDDLEIEI